MDITNTAETEQVVTPAETEQVVTPWAVKGKVNYSKLINDFGTQLIDDNLVKRFEKITKKPAHPWLKRGIFFSHRQLDDFLTAYENGEPVFLYTGCGPTSDSLHTGHMIPFIFTLYMQQTFDCPLVIQISDDEKHWFKNIDFDEVYRLGFENAKDIIAFGFNPEKTFIFSNRDYRYSTPEYERFMFEVSHFTKQNTIKQIFGFDTTATMAMYLWPIYQSIAAFSDAFPHIFNGQPANCMVVYAIDQDPYFRLARDIGAKMNLIKPCSVMSTFLDPLTGDGKMSSSTGAESTLFLTDTEKVLRHKIKKYAFSGGDPSVDIACKYLNYFENDDNTYNDICSRFSKGELTCGETKQLMADKLIPIILEHQRKRSEVTDEMVAEFYKKKPMDLSSIYTKEPTDNQLMLNKILDSANIKYVMSYHKPNFTVDNNLLSRVRGTVCRAHLLKTEDKYFVFLAKHDTKLNTKSIQKQFGLKSLKFASKEEFDKILKYSSPYQLYMQTSDSVTVIINKELETCKYVNFMASRDDALLSTSYNELLKFLITVEHVSLFYEEFGDAKTNKKQSVENTKVANSEC